MDSSISNQRLLENILENKINQKKFSQCDSGIKLDAEQNTFFSKNQKLGFQQHNSKCSNKTMYFNIIILTTFIVSTIWILIFFLAFNKVSSNSLLQSPRLGTNLLGKKDFMRLLQADLQNNASYIQEQCNQLNITCPSDLTLCQTQKQRLIQQRNLCVHQKTNILNDLKKQVQLQNTCNNLKKSCQIQKMGCNKNLAICQQKITAAANNITCLVNIISENETVAQTASCGNYQLSQIQFLSLDLNSCQDCDNVLNTCDLCSDKINPTLGGYNCSGCFVDANTLTGTCYACDQCMKLSFSANCIKSDSLLTSISLDENSCSECQTVNNLTFCTICYDQMNNGIYGVNCSECMMVNQTIGVCKVCELCSSDYVTVTCSHGSFGKLDVLYIGCQNCKDNACQKCYDKTGNGNYGVDCTGCAITDIKKSKGYCNDCRVCGPNYVGASCTDRGYPISIDDNSCSQCTTVSSSTSCSICKGILNPNQKGYNCTACVTTLYNKGYCTTCAICQPRINQARCLTTSASTDYYLAVNQTSCSGCINQGKSLNCKICEDYLNPVQKGFKCSSCQEPIDGKTTCTSCQYCTPLVLTVYCNSFYLNSNIYITQISCTSCKSSEKCDICYDKGGVYKGYNCTSCTLFNSTHGFCKQCNVCQPYYTKATCKNYPNGYNLPITVRQNSCSGCKLSGSGVVCDSCKDESTPNNIGTNCSQCVTITQEIGFCKSCEKCLNPVGTINQNINTYVIEMFVNHKSCSSCSSVNDSIRCDTCKDMNGKDITGYDCSTCDSVNNGTTQCRFCKFYFPVKILTYCDLLKGFYGSYFLTNQNSCTNCTTVNGSKCQVCTDMFSPQRKGYDCSSCQTYSNKTYCSRCSYCLPFHISLRCVYSAVYGYEFKIKQDSCIGCGIDGNASKCSYFQYDFNMDLYNSPQIIQNIICKKFMNRIISYHLAKITLNYGKQICKQLVITILSDFLIIVRTFILEGMEQIVIIAKLSVKIKVIVTLANNVVLL